METIVKSLIGIFTIIDGKINLLMDNNDLLTVICNDNVEDENKKYIENNLDIEDLNLKQCYTFSEKVDEKLLISILYVEYKFFGNIPEDIIADELYVSKSTVRSYLKDIYFEIGILATLNNLISKNI